MPPLNEPPRSRIHRAYHPAHGGPEPKPLPHPAPRPKADPAPSRWAYRMQRLMLTPLFRQGLRLGLPLAAAFLIGSIYFASDTRREATPAAASAEARVALILRFVRQCCAGTPTPADCEPT